MADTAPRLVDATAEAERAAAASQLAMPDTPVGGPLHAVCVSELVRREFPEREVLLGPWLRTQDVAMVHAPRGVGKTFFALSTALAVASGGAFLEWTAPTAHPVLYVDGEMPGRTMQERIQGFMAGNNWNPAPHMLRIVTPDCQDVGMPDLADEDGQHMVEAALGDARLVVLDNISTLCRTGVENDAESWVAVQSWILSLRKRGVSTLLVHHSGKGGQQRGTSKREDILDVVLGLRRPTDYTAADGARFECHFEKARGLYGAAVQPVEASLQTGSDDSATWTWRSVEGADQERIVQMSRDGMTTREIAAEVGRSKSTIARILKAATQEMGQ